MSNDKKIRTAAGARVGHYDDSQSVGSRGPLLLQDYFLHEKLATFNRERIPERIVHAKGSGAYGTFTVTHDISKYTRAKIFSKVGKKTRMFARFSTVGGEKGSADAERDPRGFALKFYTEDGIWDLVGNNTPVFFIKDPKKFPDFIHTQKRDPKTNCKSATMAWDFWSHTPESLHQVVILMSNRGTPLSYRHMNGYGSHTFSMVNENNERVYVKFHMKTLQGIKNFTDAQAGEMKGKDPDHAQRDLVESIENGDFPKWAMKIQVMTDEESKSFRWNPFDLTKVWPHGQFPLIDVGVMELNEVPDNYFAHVEQSGFAPTNVVDGIGFSPDKMLQGRILSYPDAHRYRIGVNYEHLTVNKCPFSVKNYHRDGAMRFDDNGGDSPNYWPNSFDGMTVDEGAQGIPYELESNTVAYFDRNHDDDDHYTQPGNLYRLMSDEEKTHLVNNTVGFMNNIGTERRSEIIERQLSHFYRADKELGQRIAVGLGVTIDVTDLV
ncbi:catalase [Membranihabitans marinus]|uniref:catalase n=1 Tax=Membranihabitans marinus TaxID=1227546 RepID=UPI001F1ACC86|nr:catalase [Membranihabitans marinus]